jgi:hypothetical protein
MIPVLGTAVLCCMYLLHVLLYYIYIYICVCVCVYIYIIRGGWDIPDTKRVAIPSAPQVEKKKERTHITHHRERMCEGRERDQM